MAVPKQQLYTFRNSVSLVHVYTKSHARWANVDKVSTEPSVKARKSKWPQAIINYNVNNLEMQIKQSIKNKAYFQLNSILKGEFNFA